MDSQQELVDRISDATARIKKREDQLRHTKHVVHLRVAKCTEVDSEIFEKFL